MIKLSNMRRLIFCLILVTSYLLLSTSPAFAAKNLLKDKQDAITKGNNQERWLSESFSSNAVVGLQAIVGVIPDKVMNGDITGYVPAGLLGASTQMIASLYTAPASGIQYVADTWHNFLGRPAYAQNGQGFTGLQGILPIWRGFRNITYVLSSIVFIIIGIMIMLRVKISPQAVITIQNAIPQLVTTLILITFSYAIAGLLIDVMQFLQGFVVALLFNSTGKGLTGEILPQLIPIKPGYSFDELTTGGMNTIATLTMRAIPTATLAVWGALLGGIVGGVLGAWNPLAIAGGAGIVTIILLLAICILMLIWMFQFYFGCLKCYVTVIFKIVVAPLELAMGAFPNSKIGFSTWIWDLLANLAVFPISMLFLIMGNMIMDASVLGLWAPNIIKDISLQSVVVVGGTLGNIVSVGIGLAVVGIMSKLPEAIPQFIFAIKPSPWGQAIGEGLDFSKNGAYRAARGIGYGVASEEVRNAGTGIERFPKLGRLISKVSSRANPADPDAAQNAAADYLKNQAK